MKTLLPVRALAYAALLLTGTLHAQVPQILNYQGRVAVGAPPVNFEGAGQFKFALVDGAGTTTFWSNDGTSAAGSEPAAAVSLTVTKGLYSVLLGDTALANMTAIPATVFNNSDVRLRVWFNDGTNGSQLLAPDQRIAAVGYAMISASVPDGAITSAKIAAGAVGSAQIAGGAVTSAQLAAGAVQSANIAAGAVGTAQMADFAVTAPKLRLGAEAGTDADGVLSPSGSTLTFTRTFAYPFAAAPAVNVLTAGWTLSAVSSGGFSASIPYTVLTLDATGVVGQYPSLAVVNGNPAISYRSSTNNDLKYARATNASGTAWGAPVIVDSATTIGFGLSLAVVNGNPAISYFDNVNDDLIYVRATNASGTAWGAPVTVDSAGDFGGFTSLAVVDGNPAISYFDSTNFNLKFVRATDASGTAWGALVTVDSTDDVGRFLSLAVVDGNPAISYFDETNDDLKYVRATDASGTAWGAPVALDTGNDGRFTSLAVVNGNPAISYHGGGDLKYVRATDASGTAWGAPVTLDSTGNVGWYTSLAGINGNPAISYLDVTNDDLKYVRATDASGTAWGTPVTLDSTGDVGSYTSLAEVNGNPAISYFDFTNNDLKFVAFPDLDLRWHATDGTVAPLTAATVTEGAVGNAQLAADAVQSANIAVGAVGLSQLADDSVSAAKIADGSIANADIAAGAAIDAAKLGTAIISTVEFNFLDGVTSGLQSQLNAKLPLSGGTLTGPLTAPAFKLPSAQTFVRQLTANEFVVDNPSDNYDRGAGFVAPAGGDLILQYLAGVQLPDGATVTKLVGVFSDTGAENFTDIDLRLRYFTTTSFTAVTMAEIVDGETIGEPSGRFEIEDNTISNSVIDNTTRAYMVDITFTVDTATSNTRFYGVRIEYTHDTLSP